MNHQNLVLQLIYKKYDCLSGRDILARTASLSLQTRRKYQFVFANTNRKYHEGKKYKSGVEPRQV